MKVNKKIKPARLSLAFSIGGFALGLFLVVAAYVIQAMTSSDLSWGGTLWETIWSLHAGNSVLFLVDNVPLVLAIAGAIIGKKQQEKLKYLGELQAILKEQDRQLKSIRFRYAKILEKVDECLFITTRDGEVLDINNAGLDLLKVEAFFKKRPVSKEELLRILRQRGAFTEAVYVDKNDKGYLTSELEKNGVVSNYQLRLKRFDGEIFDALLTASMEVSMEGQPLIFGRIIDLSSVKRAEVLLKKVNVELEKKNKELMNAFSELQVLKVRYERRSQELSRMNDELQRLNRLLADMAVTDGLTGLYNHRHFMGLLKREWERARRKKNSFCVLMIDIDYFKAFNDTWGHQIGDQVLKTVAKTIRNQTREYDSVARYGGEEFSAVLPDTDLNTCYTVALRIREAIEKKVLLVGSERKKAHLTVSVGVTIFLPKDDDSRTYEQVLQDADVALYLAKNRGRNRVEMYRRDLFSESAKVVPIPTKKDVE